MHNLRRNRQENLAKIEIRTLAQLQEKGPCTIQYGLITPQQAIIPHQLDYHDKFQKKICIDTSWCCFKTMHIDWDNTVVTGISDIKIDINLHR